MTRRISLSLLTVAAMLSMSCEQKPKGQVARCVDQNDRVVGDDKCDQPQHTPGTSGWGVYPYYRWYYGGRGYAFGAPVTQGSFDPAPNLPIFRESSPEGSAIMRGGFGSSFSGGGVGA
ncbi:MAG: hypothetical protein ABSD39_04910 [Terriglobales bacterium]|jgi:hypothetical protein